MFSLFFNPFLSLAFLLFPQIHLSLHLYLLSFLLHDLLLGFCLPFKFNQFVEFFYLLLFPHLLQLLYCLDFSFFLHQLLIPHFSEFCYIGVFKFPFHNALHVILSLLLQSYDILLG